MIRMPVAGTLTWPAGPAPEAFAAALADDLKRRGAIAVARQGAVVRFDVLPLRQIFHAFRVEDGRYELARDGDAVRADYRASAPLLQVLLPFALVLSLMAAMAVGSGAPALEVGAIVAVALALFVAAIPAAAAFGLRRALHAARAASR